jgi:predicted HTH transcriptional regulator
MKKSIIFISSPQKEFRDERRAIADYVRGDALLRRFFDVFLFEDVPACDRPPNNVYLEEVDRCEVYVGLFGRTYGSSKAHEKSPTEIEFDRATAKKKTRLVFLKRVARENRHPMMRNLIKKAGAQIVWHPYDGIPDLTSALYSSLVDYLDRTGRLQTLPFDAAACDRATVDDISAEKLRWLLETARRERGYILVASTPRTEALTHLRLLERGRPNHAGILLIGTEPQRFRSLISSEVKCLHFHGTEIRKPVPSYQVFKGTAFELVDQAVDFVMSKVARSVGTRSQGPQAPVSYELPKDAVTEAIVNAVCHRDYASGASVQVMLFADRLEVWNPGELPPALTPELLRVPHPSIPRNPLIADPFFLVRYIEKSGTGTLDMIARCVEAGLPEPEFEQRAGQWVVTLWRDWLTLDVMDRLGLDETERKLAVYIKTRKMITNQAYQELFKVSKATATRRLESLTRKGVLQRKGTTGRGTFYELRKKRLTKGSKGSSDR